jgi:hypothetical protein
MTSTRQRRLGTYEHISFRASASTPDDALVGEPAVPIWLVIDYAKSVAFDHAEVGGIYGLTIDEVKAAFAYYVKHQSFVDARILLQTAVFE